MTERVEVAPPVEPMQQRPTITVDAWTAAVAAGCGALLVGSFGPWASVFGFGIAGSQTLGQVTIVTAVVGMTLIASPRRWRIPGVVAAAVSLATVGWFVARVVTLPGFGPIHVGVGWGVALAGAGALGLATLSVLQVDATRVRGALAAGAVVVLVASAAAGALVDNGDDGASAFPNFDELADKAPDADTPTDDSAFEPIPELPTIAADDGPDAYVPPPAEVEPPGDASKSCGLAMVTETTSCGFADNVVMAYSGYVNSHAGPADVSVRAHSDATGTTITMHCEAGPESVTCTGGRNALVWTKLADLLP